MNIPNWPGTKSFLRGCVHPLQLPVSITGIYIYNLKELLAPSRLKNHVDNVDLAIGSLGCNKCNRRCDLCFNYFNQSKTFTSFITR
jgi:hypothetical protein